MQFPTLEQMVFVERVAAPSPDGATPVDVIPAEVATAPVWAGRCGGERRSGRRSEREDRVASMKSRIVLFAVLVVAWSGGVGARLYDLQVRRHPEFARKAASQQQRVVELAAPRGTIYDARGRELAVSVEVESLYASPGAVPIDRERTAAALAPLLRQTRPSSRSGSTPIASSCGWRASSTPRCRAACATLALPGIFFLTESQRYYPMRELAAHALGYVGTDNDGLAGLEARYERRGARPVRASACCCATRCARSVALPEHPFAEPVPGTTST